MARRDTRPDPKEAALAGARCLNPHPEQVTDPEFGASDFFDARDAVQVKYEMVRKVTAAALESSGLEGLVPARPGPRGASKLTEEILAWAEEQLEAPARMPARTVLPAACRTPATSNCVMPPGTQPAPASGLPVPVAAELINALATVALAGTITGPPP